MKNEIITLGMLIVMLFSIFALVNISKKLDDCNVEVKELQTQLLKKDSISTIMLEDIKTLISNDQDKRNDLINQLDSIDRVRDLNNLYEI